MMQGYAQNHAFIKFLHIYTLLAIHVIKGEPELTDPFNLLINVKLRML